MSSVQTNLFDVLGATLTGEHYERIEVSRAGAWRRKPGTLKNHEARAFTKLCGMQARWWSELW